MSYATIEDLLAIWPGLPRDQGARAQALLDDAAVRIDAYAPPPAPPRTLTPAQLAARLTVSREMVMYVMANDGTPGVTNEAKTRTMGPFSETSSVTFDAPGRTIMLTADHKRMLLPRRSRAFSISLYPTAETAS